MTRLPDQDTDLPPSSLESADEGASGRDFILALAVVVICTAANWGLRVWLEPTNLAMVYLLGIVVIATRAELGPTVLCSLASVLSFDYFFVPPVFTLRFGDMQHLLTAIALPTVGIVISTLAARAKAKVLAAQRATFAEREERLRNSLLASVDRAQAARDTNRERDRGEAADADRSR